MPRKNQSALFAATVYFVNYGTILVRTKEGEILKSELRITKDVLPGDQVEIMRGSHRRKQRTVGILSVEGLPEYQIVAKVQFPKHRKSGKLILDPVGIPLRGRIFGTRSQFSVDSGQNVLITISRKHSIKTKHSAWKLVRIDKVLKTQREVAIFVAKSRFGIRDEWDNAIRKELEQFSYHISRQDISRRLDLRNLPFVTIDPPSAKDHDDAVYCEKMENGSFKLFVAIADVSHYVSPKSELDRSALKRGASIYFPGAVVPMLPKKLSNGVCSLHPNVDRLVLVCEMVINSVGEVDSYKFSEAVIHSHAALNYYEIEDRLNFGAGNEISNNLMNLFAVHRCFLRARKKRHTIEFDLPVAKLKFDDKGAIDQITLGNRVPAHSVIEEAMLAANVCAARFTEQNYSKGMYRVHPYPTKKDIRRLQDVLEPFGVYILSQISSSSYLTVLESLADQPKLLDVLQIHLLRSLSMAEYKVTSGLHFALNYQVYTHFTSPIRRFPDLVVHRLIKAVLNKKNSGLSVTALDTIAKESSFLERRADACAREVEKWSIAQYMKERIGEIYEGVISDVNRFGVYVQLKTPYVRGFVPNFNLGEEYFYFRKYAKQSIGKRTGITYSIGMDLRVRVSRVDVELGYIDFELTKKIKSSKKRRKRNLKRRRER